MRLEPRKEKVKSTVSELADRLLDMGLTAEELVIVTEALYVGAKERLRKESQKTPEIQVTFAIVGTAALIVAAISLLLRL